jgi:hypothetical protein
MNKKVTSKIINETAIKMTAVEFIEFLDKFKFRYELLDADNILDYNEGMVNIGIGEGDAVLFIDGEYQN